MFGTNLSPYGATSDGFRNDRGKILIEFMRESSFILANGRTVGDSPAHFTYRGGRNLKLNNNNSGEKADKSVIDLVWTNFIGAGIIEVLVVLPRVTFSDHFPLLMTLIGGCDREICWETPRCTDTKLKWCNDLSLEYSMEMQWSPWVGVDFSGESPDQLYSRICLAISDTASRLGLIVGPKGPRKSNYKEPWFDNECRILKKNALKKLKICRKANFERRAESDYDEALQAYKKTDREKARSYSQEIIMKVNNVRNSKEFWSVISKYRAQEYVPTTIDKTGWQKFYKSIYLKKVPNTSMYTGVGHQLLDREFTIEELERVLGNLKQNKASGSDLITNEFYKKGEKEDPDNYRGIALVNHITKIFTNLISERLYSWAESCGLLPEGQAGFRHERGCMDNIYALTEANHAQLRRDKGSVFVTFVDFRRAFDSMNHHKLRDKLFSLGVSAKIVRILEGLYENERVSVKTPEGLTDEVQVTEGVLQGEILSPLLFILYISDMETFFRDKGAYGVSINNKTDILMLLYADDLAILARNKADLRRKLKLLRA